MWDGIRRASLTQRDFSEQSAVRDSEERLAAVKSEDEAGWKSRLRGCHAVTLSCSLSKPTRAR